eukprot:459717-Amphidinium_carterae.1
MEVPIECYLEGDFDTASGFDDAAANTAMPGKGRGQLPPLEPEDSKGIDENFKETLEQCEFPWSSLFCAKSMCSQLVVLAKQHDSMHDG